MKYEPPLRSLEQDARRTQEVDTAISEMFVKGVSTRQVGEVWEALTGSSPSASTVSRVFHTLEEEYRAWKSRPLCERYEYIFADGTYFTVIYQDGNNQQRECLVPGGTSESWPEVL